VGKDARFRRERRQKQRNMAGQANAQHVDFDVSPGEAKIAMWAVGFLDLLGYQEDLAMTDVFPPPPKAEALELFTGVVNRRLRIAEGPKVLLSAAAHPRQVASQGAPVDEQLRKHLSKVRVGTTGFSDSVFLQTPLDDIVGKAPIVALNELVIVSALSLFENLSDESPMRGGIDIALGEWRFGHLHSAATAKAVALEKSAGYPRILVGPRFVEYLRYAMGLREDVERPYLTHRTLATELNSLLYIDPLDPPGSPPGIDYLGANFRRLTQKIDPQLVRKIWLFAHKSRDKFKAAAYESRGESEATKNAKVHRYYERLIAYVEPRLEIWGLDKST
jgi:hypothetical protein